MNAQQKKAVKEMAVDVRKALLESDNISISVHNYGLEFTKPVLKALRDEGLPIDELQTKYSFMGYVTFRKPKDAGQATK